MDQTDKIYVAGHNGMVGSAIVRKLRKQGFTNIITRSSAELDLTNQQDAHSFLQEEKPDYVVIAAAKVGGIYANDNHSAEFIYQNLMIEANLIHGSYLAGVDKLLFLGSSCIYPKQAQQPIKERYLLSGYLEPTNEPYAIAKITGIKLCESYNRQYGTDYRSIMPTNLYGPNDNFHLKNSHVIPAIVRKIHLAKCIEQGAWQAIRADIKKYPIRNLDSHSSQEQILTELAKQGVHSTSNIVPSGNAFGVKNSILSVSVNLWGSGKPMREFLHVDDMADASIHIMGLDKKILEKSTKPMLSHINIGTGIDIAIKDVAQIIKEVIEFYGEIIFDTKMPDGTKRKLLNITTIKRLGWKHKVELKDGLTETYKWYVENMEKVEC
jgi:GDP-L-fucose synthase